MYIDNKSMMESLYFHNLNAEAQEMEVQERNQFMESPVSPTNPDSVFAPTSMSSFKDRCEEFVAENANKDKIAPEQEITILAFRLAILEKVASGLGTLAFVWATIVLLGGFAGNLDHYDFWVVWALLITEGTRVFSRSHELEMQHAGLTVKVKRAGALILHKIKSAIMSNNPELPICETTPEILGLRRNENKLKRSWSKSRVPSKVFSPQHISFLLHSLQLASALATVGLSLSRLVQQNYIKISSFHNANNLIYGLNLFYSLSLTEATIFLVEKAYWDYEINWRKLLVKVRERVRLDHELLDMIQIFFYDVYSTCLKGSALDGLDMDLVGFSIQKVMSNDVEEQLGGALILSAFITQDEFAEQTVRKINTTSGVIERLLEMLSWKNSSEKEIRRAAAYILSQLVQQRSNRYRITLIAGALEGIISLLVGEEGKHESGDAEKRECKFQSAELRLFGLQILKDLAKDHRSSLEIGSTPGLLAILVSLIEARMAFKSNNLNPYKWKVFKKALQLLKQLISAKGRSGKILRSDIGKAMFTLEHLRDILEFGESHPDLQELTLDILINLALDDQISDKIGGTGGILRNLVDLFLKEGIDDKQMQLSEKAGEALSLLVLDSSKNCKRVLDMERNVVKELLKILKNGKAKEGIRAAYIIRNLCPILNKADKAEVVAMAPFVLQTTLQASGKELESALGLAACIISLMENTDPMFNQESEKTTLSVRIMRLMIHPSSSYVPSIRRHTVELIIALIKKDSFFLQLFQRQALEKHLRTLLDTVSDVENFITFAGMTGITSYPVPMEDLIGSALQYLQCERKKTRKSHSIIAI